MKVPTSMKNKIRQAGKHYAKGVELNQEIRDWLAKRNGGEEDDGVIDQLIDSIESGTDASEYFIEYIEKL